MKTINEKYIECQEKIIQILHKSVEFQNEYIEWLKKENLRLKQELENK